MVPKMAFGVRLGVDILKKYSEYNDTGISLINENSFEVAVSLPERAFWKFRPYPKYYNLTDLYQIMEMLNGLRPNMLQQLLEENKSIKVKRLFLYMAEKSDIRGSMI